MSAPAPIPAVRTPRGTVYDLIADWASRASWPWLAAFGAAGAAGATVIAVVVPGWWLAATPFVCVASVGAWGLAARRQQRLDAGATPVRGERRLLRLARLAAVALGTAAAVAAFYGAMWLVFDTRWGPSGG